MDRRSPPDGRVDRAVPAYLLRHRARRAGGGADRTFAPLYLRRTSSPDGPARARRTGTSSPEIGQPADAGLFELHLVRHGETQSYLADAALTPTGEWQSRRLGDGLAAEVAEGETVHLLCAPTARAARTADQVRLGLEEGLAARGRRAEVLGPHVAVEFRNFQIWTPAGVLDPTRAAGEYRSRFSRPEGMPPGDRQLWQLELRRFWVLQSGGGDPIEYWMTSPLLTFEPPAAVVHRFWAGALRLAAAERTARVVCCTHSGPMRAFATWALGHDAGEPFNAEQVRVRIWPDLSRATVTYRGRTQDVGAPPAHQVAAWWQHAPMGTPPGEREPADGRGGQP